MGHIVGGELDYVDMSLGFSCTRITDVWKVAPSINAQYSYHSLGPV